METFEKIGMRFIYSVENIYQGKNPKLDRRFTVNKMALNFIRKNNISETTKKAIREKKRQRAILRNMHKQESILKNKLVVDYLANKNSIKYIYEDHISFCGFRNHWAKNEKDLKVLEILRKYYKK
jgi:ribosomal protein L17